MLSIMGKAMPGKSERMGFVPMTFSFLCSIFAPSQAPARRGNAAWAAQLAGGTAQPKPRRGERPWRAPQSAGASVFLLLETTAYIVT